jgi:hypothetical protein
MSPSDCRITAHVEACRRLRPWTENLVGVLPAGHWTPLADQPLPALFFTALASLAGRMLVILQREGRAPGEVARPELSPTEWPGVDVLVDLGG